jgi:hypothetical protein
MYFFESGLEAAQGKGIKELGIQKKLCKRGQAIVKKQEQIKGLMVTVLFSKSLDLIANILYQQIICPWRI